MALCIFLACELWKGRRRKLQYFLVVCLPPVVSCLVINYPPYATCDWHFWLSLFWLFFYDAFLSPEENNVIGMHMDECMQQMCGMLGRLWSWPLFLFLQLLSSGKNIPVVMSIPFLVSKLEVLSANQRLPLVYINSLEWQVFLFFLARKMHACLQVHTARFIYCLSAAGCLYFSSLGHTTQHGLFTTWWLVNLKHLVSWYAMIGAGMSSISMAFWVCMLNGPLSSSWR